MADKKSFLLYLDYWQHLELLTIEERGQLITALYDYAMNGSLPNLERGLLFVFSFIRAQMDRDTEKYEAICERNRENGAKGGRPTKSEATPVDVAAQRKAAERAEIERFIAAAGKTQ